MGAQIVDSDRFRHLTFVLVLRLLWLRAQIWGYDLTFIRLKLTRQDKENWDAERADAALEGLRRYLFLTQVADFSVVPLQDVDAAWHHFILHTRDYRAFCRRVFGRFLDHRPASETGSSEERGAMRRNRLRTAALYERIFGEPYGEVSTYCGKCGCTTEPNCSGNCGATPDLTANCNGRCSDCSCGGIRPPLAGEHGCGCDDECGAQPAP